MILLPSRSTRTDTRVPYTTLFRSQSFIPVDAKDIDSNQFYVRQVGLSQLALGDHIADSFTPDPDKLREELACLARNIYFEARSESHEGKIAVNSEEQTSELQSLKRTSYADFCLKSTTL